MLSTTVVEDQHRTLKRAMAVVRFHPAEAWLITASIYGRLLLLGAVRLRINYLGFCGVDHTRGGCRDACTPSFYLFQTVPVSAGPFSVHPRHHFHDIIW
jgi:hypothetical protein